ncbi:MAG: ABC transporter substrate-binding protein [Clostridium sp.]|uniref:ABC transporter substrate-binding protein n=1 Tax=Clostridium sp. TaxID=1506 RepID=UPI003D6CB82C
MNLRKNLSFFLCIMIILGMTGCANSEKVIDTSKNKTISVIDSRKNKVTFSESPKRVVSLYGSFSETWLLAGGELVGVTDDVVEERKMKLSGNVKVVGKVKQPNIEAIIALEPDFVILSENIDADIKISEILKKAGINYAFFKEDTFSDYLNVLKSCTDITGRKDLYEKNGVAVKSKINKVISNVDLSENPSVLFIRAASIGATAKGDDNITGAMLKDLGADNIASRHSSLLEDLSIEEIIKADPKYILVTTMGDSDKALEGLKTLIQSSPAWSKLSAVKNNRYIILPKEMFHYKPNALWGDAYEYLAKILYP